MCGSAIFGKPPKPVAPAQFQDAKSPEYDARANAAGKEARRRGFANSVLAAISKTNPMASTTSNAQSQTLGG
jgi:hypothetical protein